MKFMAMVWAAFLARQNPVSTSANPACMNMTRKPVISVHTILMAILLWPTVAITSFSVGFFESFTVTSLAVPVFSPVGSGTGGAGATAAAVAGAAAAGAAGASVAGAVVCAWATCRRAMTPTINTTPIPKLTNRRRLILMTTPFFFLERLLSVLAGPDPDHVHERRHEHLPVPELAGLGRLQHGFDRAFRERVGDCDLDLHLGDQLDLVFASPVCLGVPLLAAESLHLADRHSHHPRLLERVLHRLQQVGPDDRFDLLHPDLLHDCVSRRGSRAAASAASRRGISSASIF